MKIGFYLLWEQKPAFYVFADAMVRSAREHMPGVEIVQLTDLKSPALAGVDSVRRLPSCPLPLMRARHFAAAAGDWLFVDTDVIFQRSVEDVFQQDFELAVAHRRPGPATHLSLAMPHNAGVIFSRSPRFWVDEEKLVNRPGVDAWFGDQQAICQLIATGNYSVQLLPADYNYAPEDGEDVSARAIVHYKGPGRKPWLMERIQREMGLRCA